MATKSRFVSAERISTARGAAGMGQQQLADKLLPLIGRKITVSTISSWEIGRRAVPKRYVAGLAQALDVTIDYLAGTVDDPHEKASHEEDDEKRRGPVPIASDDLERYDGRPVWVEFKEGKNIDGYALVDFKEKILVMIGHKWRIDFRLVNLYDAKPLHAVFDPYADRRRRVNADKFFSCNSVFIEYDSSNEGIRKAYTGWYRHNEDHTCLINAEGKALPYEGLNKYYKAIDWH